MQTPISAHHAAGLNTSPLPRWLLAGLFGCVVLGSGQLQAQTIYRIVGPDGQVTFSDMPNVSPASKVTPVDNTSAAAAAAAAPPGATLPFELRQVAGKYPVTQPAANQRCALLGENHRLGAGRRGLAKIERQQLTAPPDRWRPASGRFLGFRMERLPDGGGLP